MSAFETGTGAIGPTGVTGATGATGTAGQELDYAQRTSNLTVTATTAAAAQDLVALPARAYDGSTIIMVEFFCFGGLTGASARLTVNLWDDATDIGIIAQTQIVSASATVGANLSGRWRLTPSAATHTYKVKAWRGTADGTIYADQAPCFIRAVRVVT